MFVEAATGNIALPQEEQNFAPIVISLPQWVQ
jgi:hypothetical protein